MSNLNQFLRPDLNDEVRYWINHNLKNHLTTNPLNVGEVDHIIDYLSSQKAPKRIRKMSYEEAKKGAKKWTKTLIKKAANIIETDNDTQTIIDFKNGMKFVKLIGHAAFQREGKLMRHCVSSYYGKEDCIIYSLRDINNNPHCTIEVKVDDGYIQQIKGKGNGPIHPRYIKYIIPSLKKLGKEINSHELEYLGYDDINKIPGLLLFLEENFSGMQYLTFNNKKYLYKYSKLILKTKGHGNE